MPPREEDLEEGIPPEEAHRRFYLECDEDLSHYTNEIFLMDRTMATDPLLVLEMPMKKLKYNASNADRDSEDAMSESHKEKLDGSREGAENSENPLTDDEKPSSDDKEASTNDEEASTNDEEEPTDDEEEPTDDEEEPTDDEEEPTDDEEEPTDDEEASTNDEEEPTDDEEEPTDDEEEPYDDEEEPTDDEEEPTDDEEEPTDNKQASNDDEQASTDDEETSTDDEKASWERPDTTEEQQQDIPFEGDDIGDWQTSDNSYEGNLRSDEFDGGIDDDAFDGGIYDEAGGAGGIVDDAGGIVNGARDIDSGAGGIDSGAGGIDSGAGAIDGDGVTSKGKSKSDLGGASSAGATPGLTDQRSAMMPVGSSGTRRKIPTRPKRHEESVVEMCVVGITDIVTTGVIADVDGDGKLDYISLALIQYDIVNADYEYISTIYETFMYKVSLETSYMAGTIKHRHVDAKTSLKPASSASPATDKAGKIFLPLKDQKWTIYFPNNEVYS